MRQLMELGLYSHQHVVPLVKAGKFPKPVQHGPNRVGWLEDEVMDWLRQRLHCREVGHLHSARIRLTIDPRWRSVC
ncbi:MAG: AlpA family phage regulatory protein [Pseudomonadota bacterium]